MITYPINIRTYLIKPLRITVIVRSMKKASDKAIGHAPQLIGALEKHAANTAVNTPNPPANPTANSSTPHPLPRTSREDTQVPHQSTSTAPSQHESPARELLASLVPGIKTGKVDSIQQRYDQTASLEVSGKSQEQPHTQATTSTSNLNDTTDRQSTPGLDQFFKVSVPSRNPVENPSVNSGSIQSTTSSGQQFGVFGHVQSTGTRVTTQQTVTVPSRGYVTPPPGQGYTIIMMDHTTEPHPTKSGKTIKKPNVVDATGQELPEHETSHMIIRDNETGKDVGVLTSNKDQSQGSKLVASHNMENKIDKNGNPIPQYMRIYSEPRSSETATQMKEYPKGTAFAQQHDAVIDQHVVNSGIADQTSVKRVNRNAPELLHENGYPIFDANGKEIEYDFNPNIHKSTNDTVPTTTNK